MRFFLQALATIAAIAATTGLAGLPMSATLADPQPRSWLLILSGLAIAAWVARRRLGRSF